MTGPWLLYGANGYTGELVARLAAAHGHVPVLAGRHADPVSRLADELSLPHRVFDLDDPPQVETGLGGMNLVLHCAGPFARTSRQMAEACLRTRTHYLDLTGEVEVFEALAARDRAARRGGVMLLPGVGFDVVLTDCLALHLSHRLPKAERLALGFETRGGVSRGTARTALEGLHLGGLVRRNGVLTPVPVASRTRKIDFGRGPTSASAVRWGDVSTAWHSTQIPNIEVYTTMSPSLRIASQASRWIGLLGAARGRGLLRRWIDARPSGPSDEARRLGQAWIWGEVEDHAGRRAVSRLVTPEAYTVTARAALAAVERVLEGATRPGFQTPATAFGADFVLGIGGVTRNDEPVTGPSSPW